MERINTGYLTREEICKRFPHMWVGLKNPTYNTDDKLEEFPFGGEVVAIAPKDEGIELLMITNEIDNRIYTNEEDFNTFSIGVIEMGCINGEI